MPVQIEITETKEVEVKYLQVDAQVRYWEDAVINGEPSDESGSLVPFRDGDAWRPMIDIDTGTVIDWPEGTLASIHFKVCDAGVYTLLDADKQEVVKKDGYVPDILCPGGSGYGDYIIMVIDGSGRIANWRIDLDDFTQDDDQPSSF